ncbi:unnamed protein product [Ectocarpus sp. 8 AP-2014]
MGVFCHCKLHTGIYRVGFCAWPWYIPVFFSCVFDEGGEGRRGALPQFYAQGRWVVVVFSIVDRGEGCGECCVLRGWIFGDLRFFVTVWTSLLVRLLWCEAHVERTASWISSCGIPYAFAEHRRRW